MERYFNITIIDSCGSPIRTQSLAGNRQEVLLETYRKLKKEKGIAAYVFDTAVKGLPIRVLRGRTVQFNWE